MDLSESDDNHIDFVKETQFITDTLCFLLQFYISSILFSFVIICYGRPM